MSYAGLMIAAGGGYLGGHLTYRQAAGVNHTEDVAHLFPAGWQALAPLEDLADGQLERHVVADIPVLVFREGGNVSVLSNTCSHLSAPLDEGALVSDGSGRAHAKTNDSPCVECPWHQSVFSLHTGEVVHGPATAAQPRFDTRIVNGIVEIRLPGAG